ncbi:hypothetical protein BRADI_4g34206v3 [Brachypodium distachyon]|uniref:Uncharacterized protein n=1 Tax=Brachypodium distachyon TaxID=15368 RepID=A0A2K2CS76_BRADI|nr:hypothetical protein BRADI_4g34206v3 [Brachypodium distachyon]
MPLIRETLCARLTSPPRSMPPERLHDNLMSSPSVCRWPPKPHVVCNGGLGRRVVQIAY